MLPEINLIWFDFDFDFYRRSQGVQRVQGRTEIILGLI